VRPAQAGVTLMRAQVRACGACAGRDSSTRPLGFQAVVTVGFITTRGGSSIPGCRRERLREGSA
jgi:hypothetical protein